MVVMKIDLCDLCASMNLIFARVCRMMVDIYGCYGEVTKGVCLVTNGVRVGGLKMLKW